MRAIARYGVVGCGRSADLGGVVVASDDSSKPLRSAFCTVDPDPVADEHGGRADEDTLTVLVVAPVARCLFTLRIEHTATLLQERE